ncbi:MAG: hypothetical protein CL596_04230 [Alteromonas sp.]|nr:hypothetical protein [Alteromonas sp.]MAY23621.1 hypothetical protein [Flavobacteriaceae bacterium]|tara:strand:- start:10881 stop:11573 length:693 start_codon:yes stop_codon:yes gene_type:complete
MNLRYIKITVLALCLGVFFTQCADDDDNGNVIEQATCDDGIMNGDEEGVDCGGSCIPCVLTVDFSGTYRQQDIMGRPGINTVFSGTDMVKNNFNASVVSDRADFQPIFENTLEAYHDVYGSALGVDLDYETNILGLDAPTFTTVLAQFDALQVAPNAETTYFNPNTGIALTGRTLNDDVIDVSLTLMFGGMSGTRFDGNNGTPQLTSDGVGPGDRDFGLPFPYLETPVTQ